MNAYAITTSSFPVHDHNINISLVSLALVIDLTEKVVYV